MPMPFCSRTASAVALSLLSLSTPPTQAAIVGGAVTGGSALTLGGSFIELAPPIGDVGHNIQQSPYLYAFDELQSVVLASDLHIGPELAIAAGTQVSSHYVFFDPESRESITGYVDFDADVLGIIVHRGLLAESDWLGEASASYLNPRARGLEPNDLVWRDEALLNRVNLSIFASTPGDYIRVITAAVPEPETYAMLLAGLGLIGLRLRKLAQ